MTTSRPARRTRRYNPENNADTHPPYNLHPGPNSAVYAIAIQADGKAIIGGDFTDYNGIGVVNNQANIYRLARVNTDGSLDQTFNTGDGADQAVNALAIDADGKVVIGGAFTSIDGLARNRIARVNTRRFAGHHLRTQPAGRRRHGLGAGDRRQYRSDPDRRQLYECQHLHPPLHCPAAAGRDA